MIMPSHNSEAPHGAPANDEDDGGWIVRVLVAAVLIAAAVMAVIFALKTGV